MASQKTNQCIPTSARRSTLTFPAWGVSRTDGPTGRQPRASKPTHLSIDRLLCFALLAYTTSLSRIYVSPAAPAAPAIVFLIARQRAWYCWAPRSTAMCSIACSGRAIRVIF